MKLIVSFFFILSLTESYAAPLKVAFGENRPPYLFEQGKVLSGIEFDIIKESLLLGGYTIEPVKLPNKRLNLAITKMNYDVAVGVLEQVPTLYSSEYMQIKNFAVSKATKNIKLDSIQDLSKYTVGAWPEAWNNCGEDFRKVFAPDENGNFLKNYNEPLNSETQNKMFWRDRFDVAIINKVTFQYYKTVLGKTINTKTDVVYHDLIHEKIRLRVVFKDEKIRDAFESGLNQLRRNKRYLRIFQYYIKKG